MSRVPWMAALAACFSFAPVSLTAQRATELSRIAEATRGRVWNRVFDWIEWTPSSKRGVRAFVWRWYLTDQGEVSERWHLNDPLPRYYDAATKRAAKKLRAAVAAGTPDPDVVRGLAGAVQRVPPRSGTVFDGSRYSTWVCIDTRGSTDWVGSVRAELRQSEFRPHFLYSLGLGYVGWIWEDTLGEHDVLVCDDREVVVSRRVFDKRGEPAWAPLQWKLTPEGAIERYAFHHELAGTHDLERAREVLREPATQFETRSTVVHDGAAWPQLTAQDSFPRVVEHDGRKVRTLTTYQLLLGVAPVPDDRRTEPLDLRRPPPGYAADNVRVQDELLDLDAADRRQRSEGNEAGSLLGSSEAKGGSSGTLLGLLLVIAGIGVFWFRPRRRLA